MVLVGLFGWDVGVCCLVEFGFVVWFGLNVYFYLDLCLGFDCGVWFWLVWFVFCLVGYLVVSAIVRLCYY